VSENEVSLKVALHACCGPCLLEPYDSLAEAADEIVVVFYNPNIHPVEEYERRRDTLLAYAEQSGVSIEVLGYDPASWIEATAPFVRTPVERCRACYRLRLRAVAQWAAENGFDAVATTLTVSPYQDAESIAREGRLACEEAGVTYLERDFRERYPDATRRSRELGMYRQNYCGCIISELEAREGRAARRAARRAQRES
jgi:predicted adenine nucleotide alpha hydrolase (AANH) superfamily ATPase